MGIECLRAAASLTAPCLEVTLYPVRFALCRLIFSLLLLCCLATVPACRADEPASKASNENAKNANNTEKAKAQYLPEITKYLKQYAPTYTQAEEPEWMALPGFYDVYRGQVSMDFDGLSLYRLCLDEALKGNPRGMVCLAAIAEITEPEKQQAMFPSKPDVPDAAYTRDYWLAWANKYMPSGWAETRMGDIWGRG